MDTISYTAARADLAKIMERICNDHAPIVISRQNAQPVVMLSLADFESYEETAYLLHSPANAARLAQSIADVEAGKVTERELID